MTNPNNNTGAGNQILLVDDNQDAAMILKMLLVLKGYKVETSNSGQHALLVAEQNQPNVILLDISMPGMDGYETCSRLRRQPWGQHIFIIALTGYGQPEDRQRALEAGFDAHMVKPADVNELVKLISSHQFQ